MIFKKITLSLQLTIAASFFCLLGFAQGTIYGKVTDSETGQPLFGANVVYASGKGTSTDFDGNFTLQVPDGEYSIQVSYVSFITQTQKVTVKSGAKIELDFKLSSETLNEVQIVADLAKPRETPVAFTNVGTQQIQEKLGSQDLPMLLNSTPGVYATQQGGGDGDARISIRGFSAQNVLVMVDGVPMNDMFNGRVFWTNWFGLDNMTKTMQVQRGLGASKLAIPAIGGSLNIITQGLDMERRFMIKQEVGNNMNFRTVLTGSTGRLKGDWSVQGAFSFKTNQGWVDQLYSQMFFYYVKVNKKIKKHLLSLSAFGAPQYSGQRSFLYDTGLEQYNKDYAYQLGVDTSSAIKERGRRYYQGWGYIRRTRPDQKGINAPLETLNTTENQFHKPVISFRDFITVNNRFHISAIAYASFGQGGGTQLNQQNIPLDSNGQMNLQSVYDINAYSTNANYIYINPQGDTLRRSNNFLRKNHNEHSWYGALGTFEWMLSERMTLSGGLDFRYYNGRVFSTVYDLLGGDVMLSSANANDVQNNVRRLGDRIVQDIERDILWGGAFMMLEYKAPKYSFFVNASTAINGYRQYNHFLKKQLVLEDTTFLVGYYDTITYNGTQYTRNSLQLQANSSDWVVRAGYTFKGGFNYNFNKHHNAFFNIGHFSRVPLFTFLVRNNNTLVENSKNETITSFELGYSFRSKKFSANLNGYYTFWDNKPTVINLTVNGEPRSGNANNMGARHMGVELDFAYKIIKQLTFEGMVSLGDWIWNSVANVEFFDDNGILVSSRTFDPRGVKVGDAAQHTYSATLRIEPIKRLYIAPEFQFFSQNYAQFNPEALEITNPTTGYGPNLGRQSWRLPDYYMLNLNMGYGFNLPKKVRLDVRANFMNITDNFFITDAQDNNTGGASTFDVSSATVYVGLGFRWLASVAVTF